MNALKARSGGAEGGALRGGRRARTAWLAAAGALCLWGAAAGARGERVAVAECERDAKIDYWAAPAVEFCRRVMEEVFAKAGVEPEWVDFDAEGMMPAEKAEVVCSAFRTPRFLAEYDFPATETARMHFALYALPARAEALSSWELEGGPILKVAYSPVSQGRDRDREAYFEGLRGGPEPQYLEYRTSDGAVQALRDGEADVLFLYTAEGMRPGGLVEIAPVGDRGVYFAVREDRPELLTRLEEAWDEWRAGHGDVLRAWEEELLGTPPEHRHFGMTERQLRDVAVSAGLMLGALVLVYGVAMMVLLKRQAGLAQAAARRAEESASARTRFLAMMSHELRTPLNAVIGFAEFLDREVEAAAGDSKGRWKEYVGGIRTSATALLGLINDILDLSKLETGTLRMREGVCNPEAVLGELPAIFGFRVTKSGVKLTVRRTGRRKVPEVVLAPQGFRQILLNLVSNAAKFTREGEIAVNYGWDASRSALRVEVRDTGCGISEEKMRRLWDPFVQDIASRTAEQRNGAGTGLGLPIVKRLVDAAGGTIEVASVEGRGTRIAVDIPGLELAGERRAEDAPAAAAAGAADAAAPAENAPGRVPERVLVVDDMAMNRRVLEIHLEKLGVGDVRLAGNGGEALEAMREWVPDAVLTDMWMPEMDGQALAEAMKADARLAGVPVVAVTADVEVGATHSMGVFAAVLAKPLTGAKLGDLFGRLAK